ncbi:hypothetical protein Agabi119p4_4176 [Agaricus bisporus var. burnettii]|uniref:RNase III domain-containing protein n=1 Tax=Agaricus bisporus var. burnettii TaxID=192524 RepID=A0A8H7F2S1_AGABI|nr:hypothetical protein Agabi119p4_4176 [Agaricus bisporus var. burnettii]
MLFRLVATSLKRFGSPALCVSHRYLCTSLACIPPVWGALVDMTLKPDFGPNDIDFPPLPDINNTDIRQQIFTHRSLYGRPTHLFEDHPDDLSPDNEKYEFLGDAVLGLSITRLLMELYPGLHVGPATKVRAMVVGNATLSEISLRYKLPSRLHLHAAQAVTLRASQNIQADVFESFVGGLFLDQGLDIVTKWLEKLFTPYSKAAYQIIRRQHGLSATPITPLLPRFHHLGGKPAACNGRQNGGVLDDVPTAPAGGHLSLFNQHVQKRNDRVEWKFSDRDEEESAKEQESAVIAKGRKVTPLWFAKLREPGHSP